MDATRTTKKSVRTRTDFSGGGPPLNVASMPCRTFLPRQSFQISPPLQNTTPKRMESTVIGSNRQTQGDSDKTQNEELSRLKSYPKDSSYFVPDLQALVLLHSTHGVNVSPEEALAHEYPTNPPTLQTCQPSGCNSLKPKGGPSPLSPHHPPKASFMAYSGTEPYQGQVVRVSQTHETAPSGPHLSLFPLSFLLAGCQPLQTLDCPITSFICAIMTSVLLLCLVYVVFKIVWGSK